MRPALHLALLCALAPAGATTLEKLSVDDMVQKSTSIVRGRALGATSTQRGSIIYTVYRVQIAEVLKGSIAAGTTEVFVPGGSFNGLRQSFAGSPSLATGTEYVIFLWTSPKGIPQVIGLGQGVFEVKLSASGEKILSRGPIDADFLDASGQHVHDDGLKLTLSRLQQRVRQIAIPLNKETR
jgi:hypothetical protein